MSSPPNANGLPNEKLATILAGQRPADLTSDEA